MKRIKLYNEFLLESILPKNLRTSNLLYHSTTFSSFVSIIETNRLEEENSYDFGVATSRNRNYIFGRDEEDNTALKGGGEIQLILDRDKLKTQYKIKAYDWEEYKNIDDHNYHQAEDKIYKTVENIDKYIIGFHINKYDVQLDDNNINIIEYLKNWNLFMTKFNINDWILFDKNWKIINLK